MNKDLKQKTIKINGKDINIFVDYDNKNVYMSQKELAKMYDVTKYTLIRLFKKNIVESVSVGAKSATTDNDLEHTEISIPIVGNDGKNYSVKHYNFEVIKQVGYAINYDITNQFVDIINDLLNDNSEIIIDDNWRNEANNFEIVKYNNGNFSLDVNVSPKDDTVWLNQKELALLFDTTKQNISLHINNIFNDNELDERVVVKFFFTTTQHGAINDLVQKKMVAYYNLDMIISIGYRVNTKRGIEFRTWATKILKQYLLKGYSYNEKRCLDCTSSIISLQNEVDELKRLAYFKDSQINFKNEILF